MKRGKNAYLVAMAADESGDIPQEKVRQPVFVQAWTYREAVEAAAGEVMRHGQMHARLRVTRLRRLLRVDHARNPCRSFFVNREAKIVYVGPA